MLVCIYLYKTHASTRTTGACMAEPCKPFSFPTRDRLAEPCSWQARAAHHAAACSRPGSQVRASCCSHGGAWWRRADDRARLRERRRRPLRLHLDQVAGAPRQQRRGRPLAAQRSKLQGSRVRPCLADTQLAPPRAP